MPKRKATRNLTGNVRKAPLRDTQEQYQHSHGLDCKEVMTPHAFQAEMVTSTLCTHQRILNACIALSAQVAIGCWN